MGNNRQFSDLSDDEWIGIIRSIDKLKRVYEIGNNLISFGTIGLLRAMVLREIAESKIIVEIGSGPGTFLKKLRKLRDRVIIAIDPSPRMIYYSALKLPFVSYLVGLAERIPLHSESIDAVVCVFSFRDFFNKSVFISEAYRVLKKSGRLVIIDVNNHKGLTARLFLLYIKAMGKLYSVLLNFKRNILDGLRISIMKLRPIEFYILEIMRVGFRSVSLRRFFFNNAFMLVAVK